MRSNRAATMALLALATAVAASLSLVFLPFYQGESIDAVTREVTRTSATLIQVNGRWVIALLSVPPLMTTAGWRALRAADRHGGKLSIWMPTALLLVFVVISSLSIGLFYLPAAVLMVASAIAATRGQRHAHPS